jgi:D-alanyl-lipoteichoic acid acyltransferase DltB (MBOAT superfamily)
MLSFSTDLHWARTGRLSLSTGGGKQHPLQEGGDISVKARASQHLPLSEYSYVAYIVYCLYPPLYIAGPIITFNSFSSQLTNPPSASLSFIKVLTYALRWAAALLALEALTHLLYFNCIAKHRGWAALEQVCGCG